MNQVKLMKNNSRYLLNRLILYRNKKTQEFRWLQIGLIK
jgi:hypothetical protein